MCDLSPGLGTCFNDLHQREQEAADASSSSALLCSDSLISFPLRAPAQWHDGPVQPLSSGSARVGREQKEGRLVGGVCGDGMIPAEETPVWPYRWEQSTESSLANLSLIIWHGATHTRTPPEAVMSFHVELWHHVELWCQYKTWCSTEMRLLWLNVLLWTSRHLNYSMVTSALTFTTKVLEKMP